MAVGRIRTIKPELIEWLPFAQLTDAAARLFLSLFALADDAGRCPASPGYISGVVFFSRQRPPHMIGRLLAEIEAAGLVQLYTVGPGQFLQIIGWDTDLDQSDARNAPPTRQRIDRPQPSRYPAPSSIHSTTTSTTTSTTDSTPDLRSPITDPDHRSSTPQLTLSGSVANPPPTKPSGSGSGSRKKPAGPMPAEPWRPATYEPGDADEFEKFRDHHEAKGNTFASWDAAWRTWKRNAERWAIERGERLPALRAPQAQRERLPDESPYRRAPQPLTVVKGGTE